MKRHLSLLVSFFVIVAMMLSFASCEEEGHTHTYEDGKCTVCNITDPNYKPATPDDGKDPAPSAPTGAVDDPITITDISKLTVNYAGEDPIFYTFTAEKTATLLITVPAGTSVGYSAVSAADIAEQGEYVTGKTEIEVEVEKDATYYVAFFTTNFEPSYIKVSAKYLEHLAVGDLTGTYTLSMSGSSAWYMNIVTDEDLAGGKVSFAKDLIGTYEREFTYVVEDDGVTISVYDEDVNLSALDKESNLATHISLTYGYTNNDRTVQGLVAAFYYGNDRTVTKTTATGYERDYSLVSGTGEDQKTIAVEINSLEIVITVSDENGVPTKINVPYTAPFGGNFALDKTNAAVTTYGIDITFDESVIETFVFDGATYTIPAPAPDGSETRPTPITDITVAGTYNAKADANGLIYYTFTSTKEGYLTLKYPSANCWIQYHTYDAESESWVETGAVVVGDIRFNSSEVKVEVRTGVTYRLALGLWENAIGTYNFSYTSAGAGHKVFKKVVWAADGLYFLDDDAKVAYTLNDAGLPVVDSASEYKDYTFYMNKATRKMGMSDGEYDYELDSFVMDTTPVKVEFSFEEANLAKPGEFEKPFELTYGFVGGKWQDAAEYTFQANFASDSAVWFKYDHSAGSFDYMFTFSSNVNVEYGYKTNGAEYIKLGTAENVTSVRVPVVTDEETSAIVYVAIVPVDTTAEVVVTVACEQLSPQGTDSSNPYDDVDVLGGADISVEGDSDGQKWYAFTPTADGYLTIGYNNSNITLKNADGEEVIATEDGKFIVYADVRYVIGFGVEEPGSADFNITASFAAATVPHPGDFALPNSVYPGASINQVGKSDYVYYTFNTNPGTITVDFGGNSGSLVYGTFGTAQESLTTVTGNTFDVLAGSYIVGVKVEDDITFKFAFKGLPGSSTNPITPELNKELTAALPGGYEDVYYHYTASAAGTLKITLVSCDNSGAIILYEDPDDWYTYGEISVGTTKEISVTPGMSLDIKLVSNGGDASNMVFKFEFSDSAASSDPTGFEGTYKFEYASKGWWYEVTFTSTSVTATDDGGTTTSGTYTVDDNGEIVLSGNIADIGTFVVEDGKITALSSWGNIYDLV